MNSYRKFISNWVAHNWDSFHFLMHCSTWGTEIHTIKYDLIQFICSLAVQKHALFRNMQLFWIYAKNYFVCDFSIVQLFVTFFSLYSVSWCVNVNAKLKLLNLKIKILFVNLPIILCCLEVRWFVIIPHIWAPEKNN